MNSVGNPETRWVLFGLGLGLLAVLLMVPGVTGLMEMDEGGGALIFIGALLLLCTAWNTVRHVLRYFKAAALIAGNGLIARWTMDQAGWLRFAEEERIKDKKTMRFNAIMLGIVFALVVGIIFIMDPHGAIATAAVMIAIYLVFAILMFFTPGLRYRGKIKNGGHVLISDQALIFNGEFHFWGGLTSSLQRVEITAGEVPIIVFAYSSLGSNSRSIHIPIPAGGRAMAEQVQARFRQRPV